MPIVKDVLTKAIKAFEEKKILRPKFSAEILLAKILNVSRLGVYLHCFDILNDEQMDKYQEYVKRRLLKEPVEYILGQILFYNCELIVSNAVLIPRVETEQLVDLAIKEMENKDKMVWDICCGSGCIAISLKKHFSKLNVTMSDVCDEALKIAKINCEKNSVNIGIRQGDLFTPFTGEKADYIFSNPPYVAQNEYFSLSEEVRDFEPQKALLAGISGLEFYQKISEQIIDYLNPHGKVFFEIGDGQGAQILKLFKNERWKERKIIKDLSCRDRFFFLEIE